MAIEIRQGFGYGFEQARKGVLTIDEAKAYIHAYYAWYGLSVQAVEIEGAGLIENDTVCRLNVTVEEGVDRWANQWDVWIEGEALYGEC